jgi:2-oxoisovalerate dehydrogenase E2 component (dihydrolipoyl transacylase)
MSNFVFKLPDVGEGIASAEIVAWHVAVGDRVKEDAPLVDVMTDKATVEIGAPVAGKIVRIKGAPGEMARVGDELVVIETDGSAAAPAGNGKGRDAAAAASGAAAAPSPVKPAPAAAKPAPAARAEPPQAARAPAATPSRPQPVAPAPRETPRGGKPLAAPAVRMRAANLGIDLADVAGSGPEGRIEHHDLDALLVRPGGGATARERPPLAPDAVEEVPVIGLRRQIAIAMQESKRRIPHFSYVEEVDVSEVEALRAALNERYADTRPKLTLLPFIVRAMVRAVATHPGVNAHYDDEAAIIRRHGAVHMGIATQTPRGLVVPVVRDAHSLNLWETAAEIARLTQAARSGKATREELSGSTITVSSLGRLGGLAATPIIKPPEVAIVGVNKISDRPVVRDGHITVRKVMNLSSSFDHRVVDGFDAAEFVQTVRSHLEAPAQLFIE